ncbi:MAG: MoxR family ATPase [Cyanobacteria bacterium]|nr:MoxR family ATPase [Cyanobacteriota bacterium]
MVDTPSLFVKTVADQLRSALNEIIFGQSANVDLLIVGLLSEGHILLEGIPGTAKTTMVKTLAQLTQLAYRRIQLTPDMLPAEIIGTSVYDLNSRTFSFKPGPVFTDLLLADEINRTPPKTQSALLEAMEEHQVTVDGERHELSPLFTVLATLNPIEFEGTYPLPEAQLDRFMMKLLVGYPDGQAEKQMLNRFVDRERSTRFQAETFAPVTDQATILQCRQALNHIRVDDSMMDYILGMIQDTRKNPNLELGCSPRSALSLMTASRAHAAIQGAEFITPDNVKAVAAAVIRHRLILTAEAELDGLTPDAVIQQTMDKIPVPR